MLVLVNAMIPAPGETPGEWWKNTRHSEAKREQHLRDGRRADAPFDPLIDFFHDVPQPVVTTPWRRANRARLRRCLDHPAPSRHGRLCPLAFSWGERIGFFQPSSNGGWRASASEFRWTRCQADTSLRSVNRRNCRDIEGLR